MDDKIVILERYKRTTKERNYSSIKDVLKEYGRFTRLLSRQLGVGYYIGNKEENPVGEREIMNLLNEKEKKDLENITINLKRILENLRKRMRH